MSRFSEPCRCPDNPSATLYFRCIEQPITVVIQYRTLQRLLAPSTTKRRHAAVCLAIGFCCAGAWAESVALAAGDYPPFVGEKLPDGGVTAAIVKAAFKRQGVDTALAFRPWKRGFVETRQGRFVGTFPYLRTPEREVEFLYSRPIYTDQFRLFVRRDDTVESDWRNRRICVPLGYDTSQIAGFTQAHAIHIEVPPDVSHCFKMLNGGRVDAVWVSALVGAETIASTLGQGAKVRRLDLTLVGPVHYYLIVSRSLPNARAWVERFDQGLQQIHSDGTFQRIVKRYNIPVPTGSQP